ncbi:MAG: hypothetical protein ACXW2T_09800, partial [Allosphingosinicella sp.]
MLIRLVGAFALLSTAMTPSFAQSASFAQFPQAASPRNGALAGAYLRVPLDRHGNRAVRPQAGLRIAASQDYRDPNSGQGSVINRDAFDLRLTGMSRPTLLLAGTPMTGPQAPMHASPDAAPRGQAPPS